jgi:acetyl-CoA carboxylase biotin carboxyl carrier protein
MEMPMSDSDSGPSHVFELKRIRDLVELMKEFDLREVDLREGEQRIRLARGSEQAAVSYVSAAPPSQAHSTSPTGAATPVPPTPAAEGANIVYIKSPMVGTFYSRPNPNAAAYVKVGDHVEPDKTICIIEAMKVFNEIPAEVSGRVLAMLVNDEEPVEFGKPLFKIDTSG